MGMELRQLRAFLEVVDEGHFGRAAARLNLTQPALTQRIQTLERELGVQVLHRTAREVRLTPAGELLLPYARNLVRVEDRAQLELNDHAAGLGGRLRVSYLYDADVAVPNRIVAEFRRRYPTVTIEASAGDVFANLERVAQGKLDAAFVGVPPVVPDGLAVHPVSREPVLVALPSGHRLAALDPIPVASLAGEPLILYPAAMSSGIVAGFDRWLSHRVGGPLNIVAREPSDQAVETVARSGAAITFVGKGSSSHAAVPGVVYRLLSPSPVTAFGLAYNQGDSTPTVGNLLRIVDEVAGSGSGEIPEDSELFMTEST
jgi:DNA-binding transcriptional LysR family regulator